MLGKPEKIVLGTCGAVIFAVLFSALLSMQKQLDDEVSKNVVLSNVIKTRLEYCKALETDPAIQAIINSTWKKKVLRVQQ